MPLNVSTAVKMKPDSIKSFVGRQDVLLYGHVSYWFISNLSWS